MEYNNELDRLKNELIAPLEELDDMKTKLIQRNDQLIDANKKIENLRKVIMNLTEGKRGYVGTDFPNLRMKHNLN